MLSVLTKDITWIYKTASYIIHHTNIIDQNYIHWDKIIQKHVNYKKLIENNESGSSFQRSGAALETYDFPPGYT